MLKVFDPSGQTNGGNGYLNLMCRLINCILKTNKSGITRGGFSFFVGDMAHQPGWHRGASYLSVKHQINSVLVFCMSTQRVCAILSVVVNVNTVNKSSCTQPVANYVKA